MIGEPFSRNQMLVKMFGVLNGFDREEYDSKRRCCQEKSDEGASFVLLCGMRRERHGEAAGEQHCGIEGAKRQVAVMTSFGECLRVGVAVHNIRNEQPPEKHDLGRQERPHSELRRFVLLRGIFELLLQNDRSVSHDAFPPLQVSNRTGLSSRWPSPRNYARAVARAFAIPVRSRATDYLRLAFRAELPR